MNSANAPIKNSIIKAALPNIPFDGWSMPVLEAAAIEAGYTTSMIPSIFPSGLKDAIRHFAVMADEGMMENLSSIDPQTLKIRERIAQAVLARLSWLEHYKEAERLAVSFWMRPLRKWDGAKIVWNTADVIWNWAGDTATDYNRYTKRGLLSGVITTTTLYWLNDKSSGQAETKAFLARRIENVMTIGKIAGKLKRA